MKNPLLQYRFTTPRETFPFPDISVSDIEAAMHKGMELERSEVDAIARSTAQPTFHNTIVALTYTGEMLERATTLMYNLLSANTSDELEDLRTDVATLERAQREHHAQRAVVPSSARSLRG